MPEPSRSSGAGLVIGLGLVVIAGVVAVSTAGMQVPPSYSRVGPQVFPFLAALLLAGLGLLFIVKSLTGAADAPRAPAGVQSDWQPLALISAGFGGFLLLLTSAGFVPAAVLLFMATARGFGSRAILRDAVVAIVLALAVYLVFSRLLNLPLPAGPLSKVL